MANRSSSITFIIERTPEAREFHCSFRAKIEPRQDASP